MSRRRSRAEQTADAAVNYHPPGPVSKAFMKSDAFVRGIMGPYGSGKSTACVMEVIRRAQQQAPGKDGIRRSRWAVVRNTYPELKTTTIKTWHQWVPPTLGRWVDSGPPTHRIADQTIDLEVIFVSLDRPQDISKLLGMELTGAWVDEAREIPKAILDGLSGRVGRYPSSAMGGCTWTGIIMSTNPPDSDHWWYRLAEEDRPEGFEFFRQPGGLSPFAENLDWLNQTEETLGLPLGHADRVAQGRIYYERQTAGKDPEWIKVYIDGDYGFVLDGKPVYSEYRDSTHCAEFELNPKVPMRAGFDFGLTPAAVFGQRLPNGRWLWHSELVTEDMGTVRFAEEVRRVIKERYGAFRFETFTGDPAGDTRAQTDETTPFQILRAAGIPASPAGTNDFIKRRESVAGYLNRMVDGQPGLLIHPQCRYLRKGMSGGYHYRRVQVAGDERYRDVPDKTIYSHVCEAGQYMMLGAGEARTLVRREHSAPRQASALSDYAILG
jgi:hypothetical protein